MKRAIDYIEDHLQEILNTKALAQAAGYSEYHFLRMFKDITKLTPGEYIMVLQALVILFVSTPGIIRMFLKQKKLKQQKKEA